jgi:hypothetical protein
VVVGIGWVEEVVEAGSDVEVVAGLVVVELVVVVVVDGGGSPRTWIRRATTTIAIPNPPRIGPRRGWLRLDSGPPTTMKSYGMRIVS